MHGHLFQSSGGIALKAHGAENVRFWGQSGHVQRNTADIESARDNKKLELSIKGFPVTYKIDQATWFRCLHRPSIARASITGYRITGPTFDVKPNRSARMFVSRARTPLEARDANSHVCKTKWLKTLGRAFSAGVATIFNNLDGFFSPCAAQKTPLGSTWAAHGQQNGKGRIQTNMLGSR